MSSGKKTAPTVSVLAEHVSDHLSVFVVAEDTDAERPANGGLRLLNYPSDEACIADGERLAGLMTHKHDLYGTGFAGGKIVARAAEPDAVKDELISVTAELLESLDGAMITGCDLNTSLEDMERLTALTPHVLAAVGSPVDASAATAHGTLGAVEAVLEADLNRASPGRALVHGCGAVGGTVARHLVDHGWTVFTVDLDREKAGFPGGDTAAGKLPLVGTAAGPAAALLDLRVDQRRDGGGPAHSGDRAGRQCPLSATTTG